MCFLSVDFRLQMLMERSLLAIVSLMVFQIFEAMKHKIFNETQNFNSHFFIIIIVNI